VARTWALWAGVMQGLVMQNDFRGGNIPIVGCLETGGGRCQRNLEQLSRESNALRITNEELEQQARSLEGAILPNGQKYEEWIKTRGEGNSGSS
jgi:hypothetical protein